MLKHPLGPLTYLNSMTPSEFKCFVCFEAEKDESSLIRCYNHEAHIVCIKDWLRLECSSAYYYRTCCICKSAIEREQLEKSLHWSFEIDDILGSIIKTDDIDRYLIHLNSTHSIKHSVESKSIKILKHLFKLHYRIFDCVALDLYLWKNQSYLGNCWLLSDLDFPREIMESGSLIDLLIERKRHAIYLIMIF